MMLSPVTGNRVGGTAENSEKVFAGQALRHNYGTMLDTESVNPIMRGETFKHAHGSGPCGGNPVEVQVLSTAPSLLTQVISIV